MSEKLMSLTAKLKVAQKRRNSAAERRSLQTVLRRTDNALRNELIDMYELSSR